jgi:hypothetical protein
MLRKKTILVLDAGKSSPRPLFPKADKSKS